MQRVRYKYRLRSAYLLALLISLFIIAVSAHSRPQVPQHYQKFFVHYVDNRSISEKALNLVNLTLKDVGRSFALIAGVSRYPNMSLIDRELPPAAEDIEKLQDYLKTYEFFDEIVVLKDGDVTTGNLEFFLQTYFPERLKKFPKSRFLLAYSGHGMSEGYRGYLLKNTARSPADKANSINLGVVRVFVDDVVKAGHHVLVLLNACYSGAFLKRSFGKPKRLIPRNPGAHAITAGGTGEETWHIPSVGKGSVFFEKFFAGLDNRADSSKDGLISVYELFSYLKQEVQISTDQNQNPQIGDLKIHGSKGEFFFLNRDRQVSNGNLPEWEPGTPFAREIESGQDNSYRPPSSTIATHRPKGYGVIEDSYLRIAVLDFQKSGNKFVTIKLEYQNKTDKEIKIDYSGPHAFLVDNLGNKSVGWGSIPGFIIPPNGNKSVGLRFEFSTGEGKLGNEFSLTIKHKSNPGQVSVAIVK